MRRDEHIRCVPQRVIFRQRLRVYHVQRGATDLLGLQCVDQRFLVDDLAARDVGDVRPARVAFVEELELGCREEVRCVFAAGGVSTAAVIDV